jgi:hypothetical protein
VTLCIAIGDGGIAPVEESERVERRVKHESAGEDGVVDRDSLHANVGLLAYRVPEDALRQLGARFPLRKDDEGIPVDGADRASKIRIDNVSVVDGRISGGSHGANDLALGITVPKRNVVGVRWLEDFSIKRPNHNERVV